MRQSGEIVLETRGLSKHFGGVRAVDRVDFALRENELRCVIGPNGAGKSTFFKCLTGQLRPSAGDVVIRDVQVTGRQPHEIAALGVGIKTQVPNVFEGLTAEENIRLSARRWHGPARARSLTDETIDRIGLGAVRARTVGRLAHGQRQWLELGVVIAAEPWLVLLDEPTAGMTQEENGAHGGAHPHHQRAGRLDRGRARHAVHPHDLADGDPLPRGTDPDGGHDGRDLRRSARPRGLSGVPGVKVPP